MLKIWYNTEILNTPDLIDDKAQVHSFECFSNYANTIFQQLFYLCKSYVVLHSVTVSSVSVFNIIFLRYLQAHLFTLNLIKVQNKIIFILKNIVWFHCIYVYFFIFKYMNMSTYILMQVNFLHLQLGENDIFSTTRELMLYWMKW